MVNEVLVDSSTRWKCIGSGKCCHKLGAETHQKLFKQDPKEGGRCVKLDEKNRCSIYSDRPLGCKMYPFYPDWNDLKKGKVNFNNGSLKIDSECPGYGQGELVLKNKRIHKKLEKVAKQLQEKINKNPSGKIKDLFSGF